MKAKIFMDRKFAIKIKLDKVYYHLDPTGLLAKSLAKRSELRLRRWLSSP